MLYVAPELEAESAVQFPLDCKEGVSGPHSGKRLANYLYRLLNHVGLYLASSGGDGPFPVLPCKIVKVG